MWTVDIETSNNSLPKFVKRNKSEPNFHEMKVSQRREADKDAPHSHIPKRRDVSRRNHTGDYRIDSVSTARCMRQQPREQVYEVDPTRHAYLT